MGQIHQDSPSGVANRIPQTQQPSPTVLQELVSKLYTLTEDYNNNAARLCRVLDRLRGTTSAAVNGQGGKPQEVPNGLLADCEIAIVRLAEIMQTQRSMLNEWRSLIS
jgi:hypothetical protein